MLGSENGDSTWPAPAQTTQLVNMAAHLFIVATTICRFINERRYGSPQENLEEILRNSKSGWNTQLDATYMSVLNTLTKDLTESEKARVLRKFEGIVG